MREDGTKAAASIMFATNQIPLIDIVGEPWFVVTDVCAALALSNVTKSISNCTTVEVRNQRLSPTGRTRPNKIVSESGLYRMIMSSNKPQTHRIVAYLDEQGEPLF
jgi:prophage antirepressor-like protein